MTNIDVSLLLYILPFPFFRSLVSNQLKKKPAQHRSVWSPLRGSCVLTVRLQPPFSRCCWGREGLEIGCSSMWHAHCLRNCCAECFFGSRHTTATHRTELCQYGQSISVIISLYNWRSSDCLCAMSAHWNASSCITWKMILKSPGWLFCSSH